MYMIFNQQCFSPMLLLLTFYVTPANNIENKAHLFGGGFVFCSWSHLMP